MKRMGPIITHNVYYTYRGSFFHNHYRVQVVILVILVVVIIIISISISISEGSAQ